MGETLDQRLESSQARRARADWQLSQDQHAAAYARAGLPAWAAACRPQSSDHQADLPSVQATAAAEPAAVAEVAVSDVRLNLPHDQDFGRAERFVELWGKAFEKVRLVMSGVGCRRVMLSYQGAKQFSWVNRQ